MRQQGEEYTVADEASLTAFMFGGGVTYYFFMPANVYLTGVLGVGVLNATSAENESRTSDPGVALNFDIGKEWWVGNSWGLSIAGRIYYSSTSLGSGIGTSKQSTVMIGPVMSATLQ